MGQRDKLCTWISWHSPPLHRALLLLEVWRNAHKHTERELIEEKQEFTRWYGGAQGVTLFSICILSATEYRWQTWKPGSREDNPTHSLWIHAWVSSLLSEWIPQSVCVCVCLLLSCSVCVLVCLCLLFCVCVCVSHCIQVNTVLVVHLELKWQ